jgi:nuclear pore complex protein Nup133
MIIKDTEYTDRLELKSASDRTLGVGVLRVGDENTLMLLTAATLMKVVIDEEKVAQFQAASVFTPTLPATIR